MVFGLALLMVFGLVKENLLLLGQTKHLSFYRLLLLLSFILMCHAGQILQISWKAASAMLLIPGLEFHLFCQFEAVETFKFHAYDACLRYYTCFIQLYRHHTKSHKIIVKFPLK